MKSSVCNVYLFGSVFTATATRDCTCTGSLAIRAGTRSVTTTTTASAFLLNNFNNNINNNQYRVTKTPGRQRRHIQQQHVQQQQQRSMVHLHGSTTTLSTLSFRRQRERKDESNNNNNNSNEINNANSAMAESINSQSPSADSDSIGTAMMTPTKITVGKQFDARISEPRQVLYDNGLPPIDPMKLLEENKDNDNDNSFIDTASQQLFNWFSTVGYSNIIALTGAGISTESGIPDYRGHNGSYHKGHKPMIHDQFVSSEFQRKRYWGRAMVGWRLFHERQPNEGHYAVAELERMGLLGVTINDKVEYDEKTSTTAGTSSREIVEKQNNYLKSNGHRTISLITQNVDSLHHRAGSKNIIQLHGRIDQVECMNCGHVRDRDEYHTEFESINKEWLQHAFEVIDENSSRADGDTDIGIDNETYNNLIIPDCCKCHTGFYKPRVVFFGDRVPETRVQQFIECINNCSGVLVIGTSLAVHSAYRHIRTASQNNIPVCIINVGETRAEVEQLSGITKINAPAGPVLTATLKLLQQHQQQKKQQQQHQQQTK